MKKIIYIFALLVVTLTSCDKNEDSIVATKTINKSDFIETENFSVDYLYSDTIKVYNGKDYATIVISSDAKDVLEAHLAKNKYVLSESASIETLNTQNYIQKTKSDNVVQDSDFIQCDISNIPKIRFELIEKSDSLSAFEIKCKIKENSLNTGIQKVPFYPTRTYYEYTSPTYRYCGSMKYTNVDDNGYTGKITCVRYGYQSKWLGSWTSWPSGYYRNLNYWDIGYLYDTNAFGSDGSNFTGYKIYRLCTGVLSYSPYNHWIMWDKNSLIGNNW